MKKNKKNKRLLSSFFCLISSSISLIIGLSSCVVSSSDDENEDNPNDNVTTPPNDNNNSDNNEDNADSEKPIEPDTKPEIKPPVDNNPNEPTLPENKPEVTPPVSDLIKNDSISLKDYKNLLPSQYLLDINNSENLNIDTTKIIENFDNTKVSNVKYTVSSLNDWNGILSIKMEYKNKINNRTHEFTFNFTDLDKLENQNYNLYFDVNNKNLLNAKEIFNKSINNDDQAKLFITYLKEKGTNLIFKNGANNLSIEYLNFSNGITFDGFKNSWYSSNNNLELNIQPKLLKINVYEKSISSNNITIRQVSYPTHLVGSSRKPIKLVCPSVLDYLLEKITINDIYKEDKFASYYYYDIVNNQSIESQLKLKNDVWLKNVQNTIDGYNTKQYRPILAKTINPNIDDNGNLVIQIQMQLGDENVISKNTKELTINSFLKLNNDIFYYSGSKNNKFNLFCNVENQEILFNHISKHKNANEIRNEIKNSSGKVVNVSEYFSAADSLKFKNNIKLYFGDSELILDNTSNYYTSADKKISIKNYYVNDYNINDILVQYNKDKNCFQLKCKISIECEGIEYNSSTSDEMTVNITKINTPFE